VADAFGKFAALNIADAGSVGSVPKVMLGTALLFCAHRFTCV
jgi:hypothetical protein